MWKSVQKRDRIIWKSGNPYEAGTDKTFFLDTFPQEYTAYGNGDYRINGLETEQADGSDTANLKYECYEISKGKYSLKGLPEMFVKEDEAETLEIVLKDHASGLRAHLLYGVFPQLDVITRAVRLENTGTAPVTVKKAMFMEMDYEYRELDADMKYEDIATGKVYTGAALMKVGLPLPLTTGDYQPIKFTFRAVEK